MGQGTDSWELDDPDDSALPKAQPLVSWEDISPEKLSQSALSSEDAEGAVEEASGGLGIAWFEVVLGGLLGLTAMIGAWYLSDGGLVLFVAIPPVLLGGPLMLAKRRDLRYIGYGLLMSVPVALVCGLLLWYLTLFT